MAESLSPECSPLKTTYDACFNAWFEGYLEPAIAVSQSTGTNDVEKSRYAKEKADEFQRRCGGVC